MDGCYHRRNWTRNYVSAVVAWPMTKRTYLDANVLIEAVRFIALIQREPFDYTQWRQQLDRDLSIREISDRAMATRLARRG